MFYGYNFSVLRMVGILILVTLVFRGFYHIALKGTKIALEHKQEPYVVVISSLVAPTPAVKPCLAFIPAFFLTRRQTGAGIGKVPGAMAVTWLIPFAVMLAGCFSPTVPKPGPAQTATAGRGQATYSDAFAYCAAVGTMDTPDERYTGPKLPDSILQRMLKQDIIPAAMPREFQKQTIWRCMNDNVWVCNFGVNIPCLEKADQSQKPTSAMEDFCKTNPTAEGIPAAVTGRATVYFWRCMNGKPEVFNQLTPVDPQGYPAVYWHELTIR
jgi:hypothetical protein